MTIYTGTFDVQRGDAFVQDHTTGLVCFTCIFVEASQSLGCFIEYLCTRTEYNGQLNINRPLDSQNVTKCIDGIYTSDYDISFYDIQHNGVNYQSVYQLIQHSIDGLSPSIMSSSPSPSSSSSSQTSTTMSPIPTESQIIDQQKGMICIIITYELYLLIITDGGLSFTIIVIIVTVIIIVIVTVVIIIIGEFIKLLLTLNDCYKFILVIVFVVMKVKKKHSKLSGEDNYIIFLIS